MSIPIALWMVFMAWMMIRIAVLLQTLIWLSVLAQSDTEAEALEAIKEMHKKGRA